jgi:outer membrane protein assembly factor BamB
VRSGWAYHGRWHLGSLLLCLILFPGLRASGAEWVYMTNSWELHLGSKSDSSLAIAPDGTIYFGTFDGKLWAVTPKGQKRWIFQARLEIKSSPAIGADGTIYFGSRDRHLYALTPGGRKKWSFPTGAWVDASPAIGLDGTIYCGSCDHVFYALNPDGSSKWQFKTENQIVSSAAVGTNGTIYFGSYDKRLYALRPDGKKIWDYATGGPIISSPALDGDGSVYFSSIDGFLYRIRPGGTLQWRLKTGGITESSPVIGIDGTVYIGVNNGMWAVSAEGKKLWDRTAEKFVESTPLVLDDGSVCFVSRFGHVLDVDGAGTSKWLAYVYEYGHGSSSISSGGTIYVFQGSELLALKTTVPLGKSSWPKFRCNLQNTGAMK